MIERVLLGIGGAGRHSMLSCGFSWNLLSAGLAMWRQLRAGWAARGICWLPVEYCASLGMNNRTAWGGFSLLVQKADSSLRIWNE